MYDVTAGHQGPRAVPGDALPAEAVTTDHELDLAPYGDHELSDAELLEHAWMELHTADAPVLGATGDPIDQVLDTFDARRHRYPAPTDRLAVRRTRRRTRRALRTALGGAA